MKIAIASSGLGHVARGVEAWAHDLSRALSARGFSVLLCKGAGVPTADFERVVPCWTRESDAAHRLMRTLPRALGWRLGLGNAYEIEQWSFAVNLLRVLRREQIDILHVQDPRVAVLMQRAARVGAVRTRTILAHGTEESIDFQQRIEYLQHLAPWHGEEARSAGVWRSTWRVIPNFIDTETFAPAVGGAGLAMRRELGFAADDLVVLSAAAIKRGHKRTDYVLAEFETLIARRPDLPLKLVIAGGWESDTAALMTEGTSRLGDRVRFLPRFPRTRMPQLYQCANIFTIGSLKEMMPIALLEAAATGLPQIVNQHPVMEWMVGGGGLTIDMSVPGTLASGLERLADNPDARSRLGTAARGHCLAHFGREVVVQQIVDYYAEVLAH